MTDTDKLADINARLTRVEDGIEDVLKKMTKVEEMVTTVLAEVKPTLDALMKSPIIKMLGVKGK